MYLCITAFFRLSSMTALRTRAIYQSLRGNLCYRNTFYVLQACQPVHPALQDHTAKFMVCSASMMVSLEHKTNFKTKLIMFVAKRCCVQICWFCLHII